MPTLSEVIFQVISATPLLTTKELQDELKARHFEVTREEINSVLYGPLREQVIRDVNASGIPAWKIRRVQFEAAGGLEAKLFEELVKRKVISRDNASLGFTVKNPKNNMVYHLDIAIRLGVNRYNIEVDGFDHLRADAMTSIQRQIEKGGSKVEIEIDWMDNKTSFADYKAIDTAKVYQWCATHLDWCIRFHEELLWPKDITRNIWLLDKGWKVMRLWNVELRDDMERCVKEISEWLAQNEYNV